MRDRIERYGWVGEQLLAIGACNGVMVFEPFGSYPRSKAVQPTPS